jgi:hypothetical protein
MSRGKTFRDHPVGIAKDDPAKSKRRHSVLKITPAPKKRTRAEARQHWVFDLIEPTHLRSVELRKPEISPESVALHALATFGSTEKAQHWLSRPNPLFDGKTPSQVMQADPVEVEAELVRIDHGVYV